MLSLRNLTLALFLGFAPSAIITNRACAEEKTTLPRPSPFAVSPAAALAEMRELRDFFETELNTLDADFATPEAALEAIGREPLVNNNPADAKEAANALVALWKSESVRRTREAAFEAPIRALDAAMKSQATLRPGQIAELRGAKQEFVKRLDAIRAGVVKDATITLEKIEALHRLDIQARVISPKEREEVVERFENRRAGNRESLGTTRFGPMFKVTSNGERFSKEPAPLVDEPSGTRLEVLYWRFQQRTGQLRDLATQRGELEAGLRRQHAKFSPVGPGDPDADLAEARAAIWDLLDDLRALDRLQVSTALATMELRLQIWREVETSVGLPAGKETWNARRTELLEVGRDRLLAFLGQFSEPARVRMDLDRESAAALDKQAGESVRMSLLLLSKAVADLKENDPTLDGLLREAEAGRGLEQALNGYRAEGLSEGFGPAAVMVAEAYAAAAFARPEGGETFLDASVKDVVAKLGDKRTPSEHFWSTQELRDLLHSTDAGTERAAARLQAERLLSVLGNAGK